MTNYLIQHIPEDKAKEYKTACAHFKESMKKNLLDLMEITIAAYHTDLDRIASNRRRAKKKGGK